MPSHAGFAGAVTVREHVLKTALRSGYANGSDDSKKFTEVLSDSEPRIEPDLFLGPPDIECEGSTNLLVATLPMWGKVKVTQNGFDHIVQVVGEMEITLTPDFRTGPVGSGAKSRVEIDPSTAIITARRWTASILNATSPEIATVVTGNEFRAGFEAKFRLGVLLNRITLPSIDVSFLGGVVDKATDASGRVRNGLLLIGLIYADENRSLVGDSDALQDFAFGNDVAGVVHEAAVDIMLDKVRAKLVEGVDGAGATLDSFSVRARDGYFYVIGAVSKSSTTINFSFRLVPSMYHTRPGTVFHYLPKARWVNSRTWPALEFNMTGLDTDVDRSWWTILFYEVFLGIVTLGFMTVYVEGVIDFAVWTFTTKVKAAKLGSPPARVQRTIAPPGGLGVRIGLDQFDVTTAGTYVGISVQANSTPVALLGPTAVPITYNGDILRYLLQLPSEVTAVDPALRVRWTLEDRTNDTILLDEDGSAAGRLRFDFSPWAQSASDFGIIARLYRRLGPNVTDLGTTSLNLHIREALPPQAYIRWRSEVSNPQIGLGEATDTWTYRGEVRVRRWSDWHRVDAPCLAVNASNRYRFDVEFVDRLPFPLRLLENHRKGLCPYCFYGGPAGVNARL